MGLCTLGTPRTRGLWTSYPLELASVAFSGKFSDALTESLKVGHCGYLLSTLL